MPRHDRSALHSQLDRSTGVPHPPIRNDIQGLRGLSVLLVVLWHGFAAYVPGGFVGVDVFFVISGFLIGRIVLTQTAEERFNLGSFYQRRIRRIFPALFATIVATLAAGAHYLVPRAFVELGRDAIAAAFLYPNYQDYRETDYFSGLATWKPLLHLWSIGIEAQFYLLFPIAVLLIRRWRAKWTFVALAMITACSLAISQHWAWTNPRAAFYLTPSRIFEPLLGVAVAFAALKVTAGARKSDLAVLTGIILIVASAAIIGPRTQFPGIVALLPCGGAALIAWNDDARGWGAHILAWPPLVWLGTISYSLYLWHWPILVFGRIALGPRFSEAVVLPLLACALIVSTISYWLLERPFVRIASDTPATWIGAAAATAVASIAGLAIVLGQGMPERLSPAALAAANAANDFNPRRSTCHNGVTRMLKFADNCAFGSSSSYPDTIIWGDSLGAELAYALGETAGAHGRSIMESTATGCPPAQGYAVTGRSHCIQWNADTLRAIIAEPRITRVLLVAAGAYYDKQEQLEAGFAQNVRALLRAGKSVILVSEPLSYSFDVPGTLALTLNAGKPTDEIGLPMQRLNEGESGRWRAFLNRLARETGVPLFDPATRLCAGGFCRVYDRRVGVLYFDSFHLSVTGAKFASADLAAQLYGHSAQ